MFKKFIITCDEATTICDKSQYGEATFFEKVQLNIHLLHCKICSLYSKQNGKMTKIFKMKANNCKKEIKCMSATEKEALKKQLKQLSEL